MASSTPLSIGDRVLRDGLPSNLEAEQFVLGSVLLDSTRYAEVASALSEDDFHVETHRVIFRCMAELYDASEPIEYLTLCDTLDRHSRLEGIGGIAYIASLTDGLPRLDSIGSYLRIVRDKAQLRRLVQTCHTIVSRVTEGSEAPQSLLNQAEAAILEACREGTTSAAHSIKEILEASGGLDALLKENEPSLGVQPHLVDLSRIIPAFRGGDLVTIAARPAMGKTAFALDLARHTATSGRQVLYISIEMDERQLLQRLLSVQGRVKLARIRENALDKDERRSIASAMTGLMELPLRFVDTGALTSTEIYAKCREVASRHGLSLVVVDYLQLMTGPGENRTQEISNITRRLKIMARDMDIVVVALSQLSREVDRRGGDHRPQLSDLRDSGSIEQDSDIVAFIFREEVYKPDRDELKGLAEVLVSKHRNGPIGRAKVVFLEEYVTFSDMSHAEGGGL